MSRAKAFVLLLVLWFSACAAPAAQPVLVTVVPTPAAAPEAASTGTALPPTATFTSVPALATRTPAPTRTVIPFPSDTPQAVGGSPTASSIPTAFWPDGGTGQCFKGPAFEYQPAFKFKTAEIVGKDETGLWWFLQSYDQQGFPIYCWVSAKTVSASGNLASVPVTEAPAAGVTAVNIFLKGDYTQGVDCTRKSDKPVFNFSGEIVTDGPIKQVKYVWETDAGLKFAQEQRQILAWDAPLRLKLNVSVPARDGTYSLTLRTIFPNEMVWVVQFMVKCK